MSIVSPGKSQALMLSDSQDRPIPVLGMKEGTGFVGEVTMTSGAATYITGLKQNEVYELTFHLSSDEAQGVPDNVHIKAGAVAVTDVVDTDSYRWPASKIPVLQVALASDQQSIGILSTDSNTMIVSWRRCI